MKSSYKNNILNNGKKGFFIITTLIIFTTVNAIWGSWGDSVQVSPEAPIGYPNIYVESGGDTIHSIYCDQWGAGTKRVKYVKSTDSGASWSVTPIVLSTVDNDKDADIAGLGETVCVVWVDGTAADTVYFIMSTDGGATWGDTSALSSGAGWTRYPDIEMDDYGIHVIWSQDNDIKYIHSSDGSTWDAIEEPLTTFLYRPALHSNGETLYIATRNNFPDQLSFSSKSSSGGLWLSEVNISSLQDDGGLYTTFPEIYTDSTDTIYIVFDEGTGNASETGSPNTIYFTKSTDHGLTWSDSEIIGMGFTPDIVVDANDTLHVVWYYPNGTTENYGNALGNIYYRAGSTGGTTWGDTYTITTKSYLPYDNIPDADPPKGFPAIYYRNNTVNVVWREHVGVDNERSYFIRNTLPSDEVTNGVSPTGDVSVGETMVCVLEIKTTDVGVQTNVTGITFKHTGSADTAEITRAYLYTDAVDDWQGTETLVDTFSAFSPNGDTTTLTGLSIEFNTNLYIVYDLADTIDNGDTIDAELITNGLKTDNAGNFPTSGTLDNAGSREVVEPADTDKVFTGSVSYTDVYQGDDTKCILAIGTDDADDSTYLQEIILQYTGTDTADVEYIALYYGNTNSFTGSETFGGIFSIFDVNDDTVIFTGSDIFYFNDTAYITVSISDTATVNDTIDFKCIWFRDEDSGVWVGPYNSVGYCTIISSGSSSGTSVLLLDNYNTADSYNVNHLNVFGGSTDDDATMSTDWVTDGKLKLVTNDADTNYWYSAVPALYQDVSSYNYLSLRVKGESGGETFNVNLKDASNHFKDIADYITVTTEYQVVNIPLNDFGTDTTAVTSLNIQNFKDDVTSVFIDGITFRYSTAPESFSVVGPTDQQTAGVNFALTITAFDSTNNTITDYDEQIYLSVSQGSITPTLSSGFTNGVLTCTVSVTNPSRYLTITVSDTIGSSGEDIVPFTGQTYSGTGYLIVDNFDSWSQYGTNDLGGATDDDATMSNDNVANDSLHLITNGTSDYWYSVIPSADSDVSNYNYLSIRMKTLTTGNDFSVNLKDSGNNRLDLKSYGYLDGNFRCYNFPLLDFGTDTTAVTNIVFDQFDDTTNNLVIDGIQFRGCSAPDSFLISVSDTTQSWGTPFAITVTAKNGTDTTLLTYIDSAILGVYSGNIDKDSITTFSNGVAIETVTITGITGWTTLYVKDSIGSTGGISINITNASLISSRYIDDFDSTDRYNIDHLNDLNQPTDAHNMIYDTASSGYVYFSWDAAADSWYTVLDMTGTGVYSYSYVSIRYKGVTGTEDYKINLIDNGGDNLFQLSNYDSTGLDWQVANIPIYNSSIDSNNLQQIAIQDFNSASGTLYINAIELRTNPAPDSFLLTPSTYNPESGKSFNLVITAYDSTSILTGYDGEVIISDTTGTISPTTASSFTNGQCTVSVTITTEGQSTITVSDTIGSNGKVTVTVQSPTYIWTNIIDDFNNSTRYHTNQANYIGGYTDDDGLMSDYAYENNELRLSSDSDVDYWYTVIDSTGTDVSKYSYLNLAVKGLSGGETFSINIKDSSNKTVLNTSYLDPILTEYRVISIPLSDFTGLDSTAVTQMSLTNFSVPDTIYINGIRFSDSPLGDSYSISLPDTCQLGVDFTMTVSAYSRGTVQTSHNDTLNITSAGSISPSTVSNYSSGISSESYSITGTSGTITITFTDPVGISETVSIYVDPGTATPVSIIDDFEDGAVSYTVYGGYQSSAANIDYTGAPEGSKVLRIADASSTWVNAARENYQNMDLSSYNYVYFMVKSDGGSDSLFVEFKEYGVDTEIYKMVYPAHLGNTSWQKVILPLYQYNDCLGRNSTVGNQTFDSNSIDGYGFTLEGPDSMTVWIDELKVYSPTDTIIDDFEHLNAPYSSNDIDSTATGTFMYSKIVEMNNGITKTDTYAWRIRYQMDVSQTSWGYRSIRLQEEDWRGQGGISYWIYGDGTDNTYKFSLKSINTGDSSYYQYPAGTLTDTGWHHEFIPFTSFLKAGVPLEQSKLENMTNMTLTIYAGSDDIDSECMIYLDDITVNDTISAFQVSAPSTVTYGVPFAITITAVDSNLTTVTTYDYEPNIYTLNNASIDVRVSGRFTNGVRTETVTISTKGVTEITIYDSAMSVGGISDTIDVQSGGIDHFTISVPSSSVEPGESFVLTIKAVDSAGDTVDFSDTVNISDSSGIIFPSVSAAFTNGICYETVSINTTYRTQITVWDSGTGKYGYSDSEILISTLDNFLVAIPDTAVAGESFTITVTARTSSLTTCESYPGPCNISDTTGTISVTESDTFTLGIWTDSIYILSEGTTSITIEDVGKYGYSANICVNPGTTHHFVVTAPASVNINESFTLTVQAVDIGNNTVTSYNGTVSCTDTNKTLSPITMTLTNGIGSDSFIVTQNGLIYITVTDNVYNGTSSQIGVTGGGLDQLGWLESQLGGTFGASSGKLIDSYEDGSTTGWLYDQGLAIIAFTAGDSTTEAELVLKALKDKQRADGSWAWSFDAANGNTASEDTLAGANLWCDVAIVYYTQSTGDASYLSIAEDNLDFITSYQNMDESSETFGAVPMIGGSYPNAISSEHCVDLYAALFEMARTTGITNHSWDWYDRRATAVKEYYLKEMWMNNVNCNNYTAGKKIFMQGYNDATVTLDAQSWGLLSLGRFGPGLENNIEDLSEALDFCKNSGNNLRRTDSYKSNDIDGFTWDADADLSVWSEGSEGMVSAYTYAGTSDDITDANYFHAQQIYMIETNGGLIYSTPTTDSRGNTEPSVAGTAWYIYNDLLNPTNPYHYKILSTTETYVLDLFEDSYIYYIDKLSTDFGFDYKTNDGVEVRTGSRSLHIQYDEGTSWGGNLYRDCLYQNISIPSDVTHIEYYIKPDGTDNEISIALMENDDTGDWEFWKQAYSTSLIRNDTYYRVLVPLTVGSSSLTSDGISNGNSTFDSDAIRGYYFTIATTGTQTSNNTLYIDDINFVNEGSVIEDFEHINLPYLYSSSLAQVGVVELSVDTIEKQVGDYCLKIKYIPSGDTYMWINQEIRSQDWSGSGSISFWFKADGDDSDATFSIKATDSSKGIYSYSKDITRNYTEWRQVYIGFDVLDDTFYGATPPTSDALSRVTSWTLSLDGSNSGTVYIDRIELSEFSSFSVSSADTSAMGDSFYVLILAKNKDGSTRISFNDTVIITASGNGTLSGDTTIVLSNGSGGGTIAYNSAGGNITLTVTGDNSVYIEGTDTIDITGGPAGSIEVYTSNSTDSTKIDFGNVTPSWNKTKADDTVTIIFNTNGLDSGVSWAVRIYSNTSWADSSSGVIVGDSYSQYAATLKAWCNNLGPSGYNPPDPNTENNWDTGYYYFKDFGNTVPVPGFGATLKLINDDIPYSQTTIYTGFGCWFSPAVIAQPYSGNIVIELVYE